MIAELEEKLRGRMEHGLAIRLALSLSRPELHVSVLPDTCRMMPDLSRRRRIVRQVPHKGNIVGCEKVLLPPAATRPDPAANRAAQPARNRQDRWRGAFVVHDGGRPAPGARGRCAVENHRCKHEW